MGFQINNTTIVLTRGDTFRAKLVDFKDSDGNEYTPTVNDTIRFAMKKNYDDEQTLLNIPISSDDLVLTIKPEDTKNLDFDKYVYDIQLTMEDGTVDTFIKGKLKLTQEVD